MFARKPREGTRITLLCARLSLSWFLGRLLFYCRSLLMRSAECPRTAPLVVFIPVLVFIPVQASPLAAVSVPAAVLPPGPGSLPAQVFVQTVDLRPDQVLLPARRISAASRRAAPWA